jgi:hypothetical protein
MGGAEKRKRANNKKREIINSFKNQPCADCGVSYPSVIMDFDHVRGEKLFNIGSAGPGKSLSVLEAEIAKCDVVCANCHRLRTALNGKYFGVS